jgi:hypothetical protein
VMRSLARSYSLFAIFYLTDVKHRFQESPWLVAFISN